ncbi:MAG: OsmC family peroxiredoxin [Myxococcales bacterium]|nr:MAG: OsmC family peroxiredoxin [Myxococcales bacterium]
MTQVALKSVSSITNGFDVGVIQEVAQVLTEDPAKALVEFRVRSGWVDGAVAEHRVESFELGGASMPRNFSFRSDEPREFLGGDSAPNPQEYLFAALNACMLYTYAIKAAVAGIVIERLAIDTRGKLDLRGAMGLAPVPAGCESLACAVRIKANATPEQLEALHQEVLKSSPNVYHLVKAIQLAPTLVLG